VLGSPQTLSEADRRIVAGWAADCAEHVLTLFEREAPRDRRPRDAIARTRAFSRGELGVAEEIRRRFAGAGAAREAPSAAATAAARAAGQAAAVAHMGAHALGAAAYAAWAVGLAASDRPDAVRVVGRAASDRPGPVRAVGRAASDRPDPVRAEIGWQLGQMSPKVRAALRGLPPVGENPAGPLGPGLLASGQLGTIIRELQAALADSPAPDSA